MAEWLNGWTATYAVACGLLLLAVRAERHRSAPTPWKRVAAWLGLAAIFGIVAWSILACVWLHLLSPPSTVVSDMRPLVFADPRPSWHWLMVPACILGSAFWATPVVGAFVPLYLLLLIWYARRYGGAEHSLRMVILAAFFLGMPGAFWIAYAYASPVYDLRRSVNEAAVYGGLALASFWIALAGPRVIVKRLGAGQLSGRVAA